MMNAWGNIAAFSGGNTGEPFIIVMFDTELEEGIYGMVYDITGLLDGTGVAATTASIGGITGPAVEIKIIDSKFLPKEINTNLINGQTTGSLRGIGAMEENDTYVLGNNATAFGSGSQAVGYAAFATNAANASGDYAFAAGTGTASNSYSFAENQGTASGYGSHAEGWGTASREWSHAEGTGTEASGYAAHAEGYHTTASGKYSHAEGCQTEATGDHAHAAGGLSGYCGMLLLTGAANTLTYTYTIQNSGGKQQPEIGDYLSFSTYYVFKGLTQGEEAGSIYYNVKCEKFTAPTISANTASYAFVVGNGSNDTNRSNAHTVAWDGTGWFKNSVKVGGSSQDDENAKTLATEEYVDNKLFIVNITSRGEQESNTDLPGMILRWPIQLDQTFANTLAAFKAGKTCRMQRNR